MMNTSAIGSGFSFEQLVDRAQQRVMAKAASDSPQPQSVGAKADTLDVGSVQDYGRPLASSGEQAGLGFSWGQRGELNLGGPGSFDGATELFVIKIAGSEGSKELTLVSGTTIEQFAHVVNTFTAETGVEAELGEWGRLVLRSVDGGADEFVSLRVLDDGDITGYDLGVYELDSDGQFDLDTRQDFVTGKRYEDFGTDGKPELLMPIGAGFDAGTAEAARAGLFETDGLGVAPSGPDSADRALALLGGLPGRA